MILSGDLECMMDEQNICMLAHIMEIQILASIMQNIIIQYTSRQKMSDAHIYAKIREYLANNLHNSNPNHLSNPKYQLFNLSSQLPHLTPKQIKAICKSQEQTILQKVITIKPYELYSEIARICPDQKDLRSISNDQVASRLNLYSSKLILQQKNTMQSEDQESWQQQSKNKSIFGDVIFKFQQDEQNHNHINHIVEVNTMRNIFQECDNQHCWNTNQYFGLT